MIGLYRVFVFKTENPNYTIKLLVECIKNYFEKYDGGLRKI